MDFNQIGKRGDNVAHTQALILQAKRWNALDERVKRILPANLRAHFQVACIENGTLVLLAANNMAASRLKMITPSLLPELARLNPNIINVHAKVVPKPPKPLKQNSLRLSASALQALSHTAEQVQHHPELASALARLVAKQKQK